ncbi:MAG: ATP-binding protein [Campylobacterota bacterium]|nr:ATP-binding protein [Campylobacterota bacterium]
MNVIIYYSIDNIKSIWINSVKDSHLKNLEIHYKALLYQQKNLADVTYEETINTDKVLKILTQANNKNITTEKLIELRNDLLGLLTTKYKLLQKQGVLQYHFVFPDNKVFLRVHKTNKYGDDLSNIRKDFAFTNKYKKPIRGFQQGRTAHGFRNVYPLFNKKNEHLGAMEISFSSEHFQEYLTNINKIHTHFLVDKKIFSAKAWEREGMILKYLTSSENEKYMMTMTNHHHKDKCIEYNGKRIKNYKNEISKKMSLNKKFTFILKDHLKKEDIIISFYPIKDSVTKDTTAWIVSYENAEFITYLNYIANIINIVISLLSMIILAFIYNVLKQKETLNTEVANKTKELVEFNKNLKAKVDEEVNKNIKKERQLLEQSKSAELGSMIGNIAHQWKQPLNVISLNSSSIKLEAELGILDKSELVGKMDILISKVDYMAQTINIFRDFLKETKEYTELILQERIDIALNISLVSLKDKGIKLIKDIDYDNPINIKMVTGELDQVIINIINNASDAILENKVKQGWIKVELIKRDDIAIITIEDNAGGIPKDILPKIFDEYFTTKADDIGTGLGLHMSHKIITNSLKGQIYVDNTQNGAKFFIELPLNS